jgi:hypothetical protein
MLSKADRVGYVRFWKAIDMNFFSAVKYGALLIAWLAAVGTVAALFFDTGSPAEPKWVGVLVVFCVCLGGTWLSLRGTESNEPGD